MCWVGLEQVQTALVCIPGQGNQHLPHRDHDEGVVGHNNEDDDADKDDGGCKHENDDGDDADDGDDDDGDSDYGGDDAHLVQRT